MKRKFDSEQLNEGGGEEGLHNHGVAWRRGPLIGKGGFGSVYMANLKNPKSKNRIFPQVMAIKSAEVSASSSLQKEKEVLDHLHGCRYILECYGEETTTKKNGEMVYNVLLEYASGGTLAGLIKQSGGCGLPESDVRRYARCILEGIDHIHRHGYVHCDLKPENVLLVAAKNGDSLCNFVPKIGDFGLAKKYVKSKKMKFDPYYFGGTALYMAPETVIDHIQEPPCDIWALGCIVFEMLTGKKVWDTKPDIETDEIFKKIGNELPKIPGDISKDGKDFLKGCLARKPMFRFTAEMLLIHPFLSGLEDANTSETGVILDKGWLNSCAILSNINDEFCDSSSSEDWSYTSEEGYPSSCRSDDIEKSNSGMFNDFLDFAKPGVKVV